MRKTIVALLWILWFVFLAVPASACGGCVVTGAEIALTLWASVPILWAVGIIPMGLDDPAYRPLTPKPWRRRYWVAAATLVAFLLLLAVLGSR
jgi:hypothetical protein